MPVQDACAGCYTFCESSSEAFAYASLKAVLFDI